ncbi:hypothetical protein EVAR_33086_1 [Eumeta japonica]|uniref:Uncharacterized protein n=1 Tax=Eumeta variegata TaxID=151549 RepID=A0A4C1YDG3_EUMVA|nr:hypothetical protein EVAR_33086_1 [Eumeta japonica]
MSKVAHTLLYSHINYEFWAKVVNRLTHAPAPRCAAPPHDHVQRVCLFNGRENHYTVLLATLKVKLIRNPDNWTLVSTGCDPGHGQID